MPLQRICLCARTTATSQLTERHLGEINLGYFEHKFPFAHKMTFLAAL